MKKYSSKKLFEISRKGKRSLVFSGYNTREPKRNELYLITDNLIIKLKELHRTWSGNNCYFYVEKFYDNIDFKPGNIRYSETKKLNRNIALDKNDKLEKINKEGKEDE